MQIQTTRFGSVEVQADDLIVFPAGVIGWEDCRQWVLLADADNSALAWLQAVSRPEVALPVVSPRRCLPDYRVYASRAQLAPLQLAALDETYVLTVVSKNEDELTLNLRAPILVNLSRRLGCQLITNDEQPVQYRAFSRPALRKSA